MTQTDRIRVVYHGAVVLLVGLLCGIPTVPEEEPMRLWHTAHESLILIGVLLFAASSVLPVLILERRESRALVWSLMGTGYGLMVGLIVQAVTGQHAFGPSRSPVLMLAFIANATGMLGSVISAALVLQGARAAHAATVPTGAALGAR